MPSAIITAAKATWPALTTLIESRSLTMETRRFHRCSQTHLRPPAKLVRQRMRAPFHDVCDDRAEDRRELETMTAPSARHGKPLSPWIARDPEVPVLGVLVKTEPAVHDLAVR